MVSDILPIFTNYYQEFQMGGLEICPFYSSSIHSPTPWLFVDPLDVLIDPWGLILTTLRTLDLDTCIKVSNHWEHVSNERFSYRYVYSQS